MGASSGLGLRVRVQGLGLAAGGSRSSDHSYDPRDRVNTP